MDHKAGSLYLILCFMPNWSNSRKPGVSVYLEQLQKFSSLITKKNVSQFRIDWKSLSLYVIVMNVQ